MPRLEGTLQLSDSARETNSPWELKAASDHAGQLGGDRFPAIPSGDFSHH